MMVPDAANACFSEHQHSSILIVVAVTIVLRLDLSIYILIQAEYPRNMIEVGFPVDVKHAPITMNTKVLVGVSQRHYSNFS